MSLDGSSLFGPTVTHGLSKKGSINSYCTLPCESGSDCLVSTWLAADAMCYDHVMPPSSDLDIGIEDTPADPEALFIVNSSTFVDMDAA